MLNEYLAIESLTRIQQALDEAQMPFWITDGTLLGFYREGNLINHDTDMDLGCHIKHFNPDIVHILKRHGINIQLVYGSKECGLEFTLCLDESFWFGNGYPPRVDLFFFYDGDDSVWHGAWLPNHKTNKRTLIKYHYEPFELQPIEFLTLNLHAPTEIKKYIITKYGFDWRTPNAKWHWAFDPKNHERTQIKMPARYSYN